MKVKNLIEELHKLDPELVVVRPGYEGGYHKIERFVIEDMVENYYKEWWYGPHEAVSVLKLTEPDVVGNLTALIIT